MRTRIRTVAIAALVAPLMAGCATKGYVRKSLADQRTQLGAQIDSERQERIAADSQLMGDVAALRKDLDSLRTDFGAKITALEDGMQFDLPVHFAYDDATIREEDHAALDRFAKVANKYYPGSVITVEGFADPAGGNRYNLALSRRRADAVKGYLGTQGTSADLRSVGYGESRLVVPNAARDEPGAEKNRRVVFVIESKGDASGAGIAASSN